MYATALGPIFEYAATLPIPRATSNKSFSNLVAAQTALYAHHENEMHKATYA